MSSRTSKKRKAQDVPVSTHAPASTPTPESDNDYGLETVTDSEPDSPTKKHSAQPEAKRHKANDVSLERTIRDQIKSADTTIYYPIPAPSPSKVQYALVITPFWIEIYDAIMLARAKGPYFYQGIIKMIWDDVYKSGVAEIKNSKISTIIDLVDTMKVAATEEKQPVTIELYRIFYSLFRSKQIIEEDSQNTEAQSQTDDFGLDFS